MGLTGISSLRQANVSMLLRTARPRFTVALLTSLARPFSKKCASAFESSATPSAARKLGTLRGTVTYIAPDFDAPLDDLTLSLPFDRWMHQAVIDLRLTILPITIECADVQSKLDNYHRDPFDRLLVAHVRIDDVPVISSDPIFDRYGIQRIW